jgi:hypothetical protein
VWRTREVAGAGGDVGAAVLGATFAVVLTGALVVTGRVVVEPVVAAVVGSVVSASGRVVGTVFLSAELAVAAGENAMAPTPATMATPDIHVTAIRARWAGWGRRDHMVRAR